MIRSLQMGKPLSSLNKQSLFVSKYSHIDFNVSLTTETMRELIETLRHTNFYAILEPLMVNDHKINLFAAEMALDLYYYKKVIDDIKKHTSGKDAEILSVAFGLDVDFRNMMWIYRGGKKFYDLRKEILFSYMLPGGYKLKKDRIIDLVETDTAQEVLSLLKRGPYKDIVDFESGHWDNSFYKYYGKAQQLNMRFMPFTIAPIIGYVFIKEIEILNLTTIIEGGVRYNVDQEVMASFLSR